MIIEQWSMSNDSSAMDCLFFIDAVFVGVQHPLGPTGPDRLELFPLSPYRAD
jgi:hypothetical protein